jgi:hypothetical protein
MRRERRAVSYLADQGFLHKRSASDQHRTEKRKNQNTPAPIVFLCNCCRWLARKSGGRVEEPCSDDPRGRGAISPSCGCSPVSACTRTEWRVSCLEERMCVGGQEREETEIISRGPNGLTLSSCVEIQAASVPVCVMSYMWHGYLDLKELCLCMLFMIQRGRMVEVWCESTFRSLVLMSVETPRRNVWTTIGYAWVIFWFLVPFPVISVVNRRVSLFSIPLRSSRMRRQGIDERDKTRRGREDAGRHTEDGNSFEFHTTRHGVYCPPPHS